MKVRIKRSGSLTAGYIQSFRIVKAGVGLKAGVAHAELSGSVGEQPGHDWRLDRRAATRGAGGNGADVPRRAWGPRAPSSSRARQTWCPTQSLPYHSGTRPREAAGEH